MEPTKKALLATHVNDPSFNTSVRRSLLGYELTAAATVEEALKLCAGTQYDAYVIEANLGHPRQDDITGFRQIYNTLRAQGVQGLEQRMVGFSSTQGALDAVEDLGIPTVYKRDLGLYLSRHFRG